ncbi:Arc family DNA-binding protein [Chitiniphilus eburneus]|uniref:Arc family DNA-binding protein n=1 Tax=Chitiniphilus eburneus TaxID=2571148 RepID=A0A4U0Q238_9NEIS|nr:Arc family DNA-binding protein [Chitiniphilus eburneus]
MTRGTRADPQTNFRMPADLKAWLKGRAAENHRSLTGELIATLEESRRRETREHATDRA